MEDDKIASGGVPAEEVKTVSIEEKKADEPAPAPKHYVLSVDPVDFGIIFGVI